MRHDVHTKTRKGKPAGRQKHLAGYLWLMPLLVLILTVGFSLTAYGAGGDPIWQFGDAMTGKQEAKASAVDSQGNVIITGYQNLSGGINDDFYTVKFKSDGSGTAWRASFDKAGGSDQATAVVVDGDDNIIVTGYVWNGTNNDIHTIKYNGATGAVIWQHTFNGAANGNDVGTSIAVDNINNVYVGGYSQNAAGNDDYIVLKYNASFGANPDGTPLWQTTYDGPAHNVDRLLAIAADASGVAVTGYSSNGTTLDLLTIKYSLMGAKLLESRSPAGGNSSGKTVKMDGSGNVIVTGYTSIGTNKDIYTAKYNGATGAVIWQNTYNGGYDDEANGLYVDAAGDVYITGSTWSITGHNDFFTAKYNGVTGSPAWPQVQIFNSGGDNDDIAVGIVGDPDGDIFVTGYTSSAGNYDFQTIKYKKDNGNQLWQKSFNGAANKNDRAVGIGISRKAGDAGNVLVAGWSDTAANGYDYYVIKYDSGLLNSPTNLTAQAQDNTSSIITWVDNSTNEDEFRVERCKNLGCTDFAEITVITSPPAPNSTGTVTYLDPGLISNTYYSYRVRAYNAANGYSHYSNTAQALTVVVTPVSPAWTYIYNGLLGSDDYANAIAIGPDNNPVVTGQTMDFAPGYTTGLTSYDYLTIKLNKTDKSVIWSDRYNDSTDAIDIATCVAVDATNAVTVSGYATLYNGHSGDVNSLYTIRYPAAGPPESWHDQYNGPVVTGAIDDRAVGLASATDGSNNVVIVGYGKNAAGNEDIYVVKYQPNGIRAWAATPFDGNGGDDFPTAVAIAADGNIFVTGYSEKAAKSNTYNFFTAKYDSATGARIWTDVYSVIGSVDNKANGLALDAAGDLYVTGYATNAAGNRDFYTIKYNGTSGTAQKIWEKSLDGAAHGDDEAIAVKIDPIDNNIIVAGTTLSGTGDHDFTIIRYSQAGDVIWQTTLQRPANDDTAKAMTVDYNGNIFVTGITSNGTTTDSMTIKYDYLGNYIGATIFNGAANSFDETSAIAANSLNEVFVAGYTENAGANADYLTYKIAANTLSVPYPVTAAGLYTTATLTWTDVSTVKDGFNISRQAGACSPTNANIWTDLPVRPSGATSYTDTALNAGSTFCYRIATFQNGGAKSRFNYVKVTTQIPPPPTGLTAAAVNTSQINLAWTDTTSGETGFKIYQCAGVGCTNFTQIGTAPANATTYQDTSVCKSTSYNYKLLAYGADWESQFNSTAASATTSAGGTPVLTVTRISEVQVNLTWTDPNTDETGYRVYRCTGSGCSNFTQMGGDLPPNTFNYIDTGLAVNTVYTYQVTAYKTAVCGWTMPSVSGNATTTLLEPNGLTATVNSTTQVTLAWTDRTSSETGFKVERCQGSGCINFAQISTAAANATSYADSTVANGAAYRYQVRATNGTVPWDSNYSAIVPANVTAAGIPVLTATAASEVQVNLAWTDPNSDETGYRVYRCTGNGCTNFAQIGSVLPPNTVSYNDTTVTPGSTYTYQVRAFKTATAAWETISNSSITTTLIAGPTGLTVTPMNTTRIDLSWTDTTSSETGFKIERCQGAGCSVFTQINIAAANATSYTDSTVANGTAYYYQVRATNGTVPWDSGYSNTAQATTPVAGIPVLTASRGSEMMINLTWTDPNTDESGFKVERCGISVCSETDFVQTGGILPPNTTSYSDGMLTPNTTYTYRVKAFKTATNPWETVSVPVSATTTIVSPTALACTVANTTQVNCTWTDNSSSETGFKVEKCVGSGCSNFAVIGSAAANATTFADTSACSMQTATYRVQATRGLATLSNGSGCWTRRVPVTIANFQSNFQVKLTVAYDSAMQTAFDDIRFFDAGSGAELPYFIENKTNGVSATVWIKTGPNNAVYMYYGNVVATSASNGADVFEFFDDFNGTTLDMAKWSATGTYSISSGVLRVDTGAVYSKATVAATPQNRVFEMKSQWLTGAASYAGINIANAQSTQGGNAGSNALAYYLSAADATASLLPFGANGTAASYNIVSGSLTATVSAGGALYNPFVSNGQNTRKPASGVWSPAGGGNITRVHVTAATESCCDHFTVYNAAGTLIGDYVGVVDLWVDIAPTTGIYTIFTSDGSVQGGFGGDVAEVTANTITMVNDLNIYRIIGYEFRGTTDISYFVKNLDQSELLRNTFTGTWNAAPYLWLGFNTGAAAGTTDIDDMQVDWVRVRKYSATAPTAAIGTKETAPCFTFGATWDSNYSNIPPEVTTTAPIAPTGLTATRASEVQINLAWTDTNNDESGYKIERCGIATCADTDFVEVGSTLPNAVIFNDTGLVPGTAYTYRVKAFKTSACGWVTAPSNTDGATTTVIGPTGLSKTSTNSTQICMSWVDTTSSETGFVIERCDVGGVNCILIPVGANTTTYCDNTVCNSSSYTYRIKAVNTTVPWDSTYSNTVAAATSTIGSAPTGLTATRVSEVQINLSWTDNSSDEGSFQIERCEDTGSGCSNFASIGNAPTNATAYSDFTAKAGKKYNYQIKALKTAPCGWETLYSNTASATATILEPNNFTCTPVNTTQVSCSWTDRTVSESGFKIERCQGGSCSNFAPLASTGINSTTYQDTTVTAGTGYTYQIKAVYEGITNNGGGCWSKRLPLTTANFQPNFLIRVAIPFATGMKSDFSDIRFIDGSTDQEMPYWIESKTDSSTATVWFKTGQSNSIYLYYGNASATSSSNINSIYGTGLVGYWPFNEASGTVSGTTADKSGLGNNATFNGFVAPYGIVSTGKYGNGLSLDGVQTNLTVPDTSNSSLDITGSITVETWYQYQPSPFWSRIISKPTIGGVQPWDIYHIYLDNTANAQKAMFRVSNGNALPATAISSPAGPGMVAGNWYHLVGVYDATTGRISIYVNATEYGTTVTPITIAVNNESLTIGSMGTYGNYTKGTLDEVRIYNRALTAAEIASRYAATVPSVTLGTVESPACYSGGSNLWSSAYSISAPVTTPAPLAPGSVTATRASEVQINLAWTNTTTDETGFKVERCAGAGCSNFVQVGSPLPAKSTTFYDTGLTPNTSYTYQVKAYKTATNSWVTTSTPSAQTVTTITPPSGFTCSVNNTTQVTCSWTDNTVSETGFKLYRCQGAGCTNFTLLGTVLAGITTYADPSVCNSSPYQYQVTAYGTGWESNPANAPVTTPAPVAPSGMAVTAISTTQINLLFADNTTDETGFKIERCTGVGCNSFSQIITLPTIVTPYSDTLLTPSTTYCYRSRAYKTASCGWDSGYSNTACSKTFPALPTNLTATALNAFKIRLNWTETSTDADGFEIEVQIWNAAWVHVATLLPTVLTFTDVKGIEPQKNNNYRIRAYRGQDKTGYTYLQTPVTTPAYATGDGTCP